MKKVLQKEREKGIVFGKAINLINFLKVSFTKKKKKKMHCFWQSHRETRYLNNNNNNYNNYNSKWKLGQ
jgi:hypothetical protein